MGKNAIWLLLILILASSLVILPQSTKAETKTVTVPDDYPTIQQAIDQANPGDTVYVKAGNYTGTVEINKSIALIGEDNKAIISDWTVTGQAAILITHSNVTVSGITIDNPTQTNIWLRKRGIHLLGVDSCTITHNIVRRCDSGSVEAIWLYQSTNNYVADNLVEANSIGISVGASSNNRIINNTARSNSVGINVYDNSSGNFFSGNNLNGNGISLQSGATGNTFTANTLTASGVTIGNYDDNYDDTNNIFYHNNFMGGGSSRAIESYDFSGTNRFDNGQEGNYYSDYHGIDHNGDGIGDTPYSIVTSGADMVDPYPLIAPWNGNTLLPVIHILSPASNATLNTGDVELSFNLSRTASEVKYSLDGAANTTITGNTTLSNLSGGNHTLTLYATSPTGAQALPQTVTFTVDLPLIPNDSLVWVAITVFLAVAIAIVVVLFVSKRINRRNQKPKAPQTRS
jgi:parallel beta-helix repeat (two copies)